MKKLIPVIIAIALIIIVACASFGNMVYEKYSYGQERADLNEYFTIFDAKDVPIILQDEKLGKSATLYNGNIYFDIDLIKEIFTERFYYDENEALLLYTSANTTYEVGAESKLSTDIKTGESKDFKNEIWFVRNDQLYILADYVQNFVNFEYEVFADPNHMQIYTEWNDRTIATIKSDTQVRWRGGVKSEILTDVSEGDNVIVLEEMDEWTKVKTDDAYIGYVENKMLKNQRVDSPSPANTAIEEEFTYLTRDYRINLTWDNIEYPQDGSDLRQTMANSKTVNVVSPTWYWLTDNEGNFGSVANANFVTGAHDMGMEVWALIDNFHYGTDVDTYEVIGYTSKRRDFIERFVADAVSYGVDGINVDFERMDSHTTPHFVQFIRELTLKCHEYGIVVSVDNYVPTEYTAHYNRSEQGKFADYIIIMGYDEHYAGDDTAGSVSSVSWMDKGIADTVKVVDSKRVINAIPFYTRVWKTSGGDVDSEAVTMAVQNDFIARNNITTRWDSETNQNYGEMTADGVFYQVWLEDADSVRVRLSVMSKYNLGGVASWKIGQETPDIWDVIAEYMQQ